jgi:hypothetical protein
MVDSPQAAVEIEGTTSPVAPESPPLPVVSELTIPDELKVVNEKIDQLFEQKTKAILKEEVRGREADAQTAWSLVFCRKIGLAEENQKQTRNKAVLALKLRQLERLGPIEANDVLIGECRLALGIEATIPPEDQMRKERGLIADFIDAQLAKISPENKLTPDERRLIESGAFNAEGIIGQPASFVQQNFETLLTQAFQQGSSEIVKPFIDKLGRQEFLNLINDSLFGQVQGEAIIKGVNQDFSEAAQKVAPGKFENFLKRLPGMIYDQKWAILLMLALQGPGLLASLLPEEVLRPSR